MKTYYYNEENKKEVLAVLKTAKDICQDVKKYGHLGERNLSGFQLQHNDNMWGIGATDNYRLLKYTCYECPLKEENGTEIEAGLYRIVSIDKNVVVLEEYEDKYPNIDVFLEGVMGVQTITPLTEVCFNPKLLYSMTKYFTNFKGVKLSLAGSHKPILIELIDGDTPFVGKLDMVFMPMLHRKSKQNE